MKPERIKIPLIDIVSMKLIERYEGYIELQEHTFTFRVKFFANEAADTDDLSGKWKEQMSDTIIVARRSQINSVEKILTNEGSWQIGISIKGLAKDILWYHKTEESASKMFDRLLKYVFPDDYPYYPQPGQTGQEGTARQGY